MEILPAHKSRPLEGGPSFSLKNRIFRAVWNTTWFMLAAWTPPPFHIWRNLILRLFGADLQPSSRVYGSTKVWYPPHLKMGSNSVIGPNANCYCMDRIEIGNNSVISQGAHLCTGTHDIKSPHFQLQTRPILIEDNVWIATDSFIGPGVNVKAGVVVGACSALFTDTVSYGVYRGNPAQLIKMRQFRNT